VNRDARASPHEETNTRGGRARKHRKKGAHFKVVTPHVTDEFSPRTD
jgi:hypothetical protein